MSACTMLLLQAPPPEGLLLAMALWYALGFLGMLLAWHNYRKRKGSGAETPQGSQHDEPPPPVTKGERREP